MRLTIWGLALAALCGLAGCGASHTEAVCLELSDKVGTAGERCRLGTYQQSHDGFVAGFGGCGQVRYIRDEPSLRSQCYPYWDTAPCSAIADPGTLPAACRSQLAVDQ
jgi:hypothetical protein